MGRRQVSSGEYSPRGPAVSCTQHLWMFLSEERVGRGRNPSPPATAGSGEQLLGSRRGWGWRLQAPWLGVWTPEAAVLPAFEF